MASYRDELITLVEHKAIDQKNIKDAVTLSNIKPSGQAWLNFINNLLLWLGCIAIGFSFIYFLAHNWSQIGRFAKFALVEAGLVLAILAYVKVPVGSSYAHAALTVASMLLGALMALFGQTYQTGADPWQLFFNWALLITPWALIARFSLLWIIWLALLNLSIVLYCQAFTNPLSLLFNAKVNILWLFVIFNSLSLISWQVLSYSRTWMQNSWAIRLIAIGVGVPITCLAVFAIIDSRTSAHVALPVWVLFLASFYVVYRKLQVNLFMLAGGCLSFIVVAMTFLGDIMLGQGDETVFLLLAMAVVALGMGAAFWLKKVQREAQNAQ